jgi:exoribonuclease-2
VIERLDLLVDNPDAGNEPEDGDDEELATPLALAIDMDEAEGAAPEAATEAPPA